MVPDRHDLLINAADLAEQLPDPDLVVVDCRFNLMKPALGRQQWAAGHVPGAFYADLDSDLSAPITETSGRHPLPDADAFAALLEHLEHRPVGELLQDDADDEEVDQLRDEGRPLDVEILGDTVQIIQDAWRIAQKTPWKLWYIVLH